MLVADILKMLRIIAEYFTIYYGLLPFITKIKSKLIDAFDTIPCKRLQHVVSTLAKLCMLSMLLKRLGTIFYCCQRNHVLSKVI